MKDLRCPKCKSQEVIIRDGRLICEHCRHSEPLYDFAVSESFAPEPVRC